MGKKERIHICYHIRVNVASRMMSSTKISKRNSSVTLFKFEEVLEKLGKFFFNNPEISTNTNLSISYIKYAYVYLGGFGKFQILILVLLLTLEIPVAFVTFIPIFVAGKGYSNTSNSYFYD